MVMSAGERKTARDHDEAMRTRIHRLEARVDLIDGLLERMLDPTTLVAQKMTMPKMPKEIVAMRNDNRKVHPA